MNNYPYTYIKINFGAIYTCEGEKVTQKRLWLESLPNILFLMFNSLDIVFVIEVTTEKSRRFDIGKSVASSSCQSIRHFREKLSPVNFHKDLRNCY